MRTYHAALPAAVILLSSAACRGERAQGQIREIPPTQVTLTDARSEPIDDISEYVGTLRSLISTTIQPQVDGQITQIFVKSGDRMAQGAPLIQVDPRRQQAAVSNQEAELA